MATYIDSMANPPTGRCRSVWPDVLDGVYRVTASEPHDLAAFGSWTSSNTFAVQIEMVGYSTFDSWEFTFEGDTIAVVEHSIAGDFHYEGRAQ